MLPIRLDLRFCVATLALALALPHATTAQEQTGRAAPDSRDPIVAPRTALIRTPATPRPTSPMKLRVKPASAQGKVEHFTDDGLGLPGAKLTPREVAKLEAARVAVAAARSLGGASTPAVPLIEPTTLPGSLSAEKLARLRASQPGQVPSDPALSGLPAVAGSRQKQGSKVPSVRELEKLKAAAARPVAPETAKETER